MKKLVFLGIMVLLSNVVLGQDKSSISDKLLGCYETVAVNGIPVKLPENISAETIIKGIDSPFFQTLNGERIKTLTMYILTEYSETDGIFVSYDLDNVFTELGSFSEENDIIRYNFHGPVKTIPYPEFEIYERVFEINHDMLLHFVYDNMLQIKSSYAIYFEDGQETYKTENIYLLKKLDSCYNDDVHLDSFKGKGTLFKGFKNWFK